MDQCQAYHAVERQHGAPHLSLEPVFVPEQPRIHVQVRDLPDGAVGVEWDVQACTSFSADPGRWQRLCPDRTLPT